MVYLFKRANKYPMSARVGIVGFRGYSGVELVKILDRHPGVEPVLLEHRADSADRPLPRGSVARLRLPCTAQAAADSGLAAVLLATPPEVSMNLAPAMLAVGIKVVDLSGAFRLRTVENYQHWYKEPHSEPELLATAAYGLPEFQRESIRPARLVANPGCYPTAANLALRPLVAAGVVERSHGIVCDGKSGVSGAGRKPSLKTSFCEVTDNLSVYSILRHRHVPEVLMHSSLEESEFSFTAQLLPLERGILETIYFRVTAGTTAARLIEIYERQYAHEPFVRLYDPGQVPDLKAVQYTNFCDIGASVNEATGRAVVVSVIDNLIKGAAGQAVQNLNLILGFAETEGLL
jgi:N-acetyl-gamma-glutamyl-phosphate reductase